MFFSYHNYQLNKLHLTLKTSLNKAQNIDDLCNIVEQVKKFSKPLKYNNSFIWLTIVILFLAMIGLMKINIIFLFIYCVLIIPLVIIIMKRKCTFNDLSREMYYKKIFFDNQLIDHNFANQNVAKILQQKFSDFNRGDLACGFELLFSGQYQGKEHQFTYYYYHCRYASRNKEISKQNFCERYGIIVNFPYVANLLLESPIFAEQKSIYQPISVQFNRYYIVKSNSQINAAKFLKPMVVKLFEYIYPKFSQPRFEFNHTNQLCMSFNDKNILEYNRYVPTTLHYPEQFISQLKKPLKMPRLNMTLSFIELLMKYSDNNFEIN